MNCDELFEFRVSELSGYGADLTKYKRRDDPAITELELPSEYGGVPVRGITANAFKGAQYLRSVYVPDSVKRLSGCAFADCPQLVSARLPEELFVMASYVFWNATALKEVILPKKLETLPIATFMGCSALESVELPRSINKIETWAFAQCAALKAIEIPESVKYIEGSAFMECDLLEQIIFRYPLVQLGLSAFEDCPSLPAKYRLMSVFGTADLENSFFRQIIGRRHIEWEQVFVKDVFELALSLGKFEGCDMTVLAARLAECDIPESAELAEKYGWITSETIDMFIDSASKYGRTEMTARLLELKKRKFGFDGENSLDL